MITVRELVEGKKRNITYSMRPDNTVIEALDMMSMANIGAVIVMDGGELVGIFSERDYARKGIIQGRKAKSTPLSEVMTHKVITVTPEMNIDDCMNLFTSKFIRHLPVVEEGKVISMLSIGDVVSAIIKEQSEHINFLEKYITGG